MYELYAVSNHYGGLGGGHYTAYCQVEGQGWCNFDDTSASTMDPAKLESPGARESAYVLFYRRQAETGVPLAACRAGHAGSMGAAGAEQHAAAGHTVPVGWAVACTGLLLRTGSGALQGQSACVLLLAGQQTARSAGLRARSPALTLAALQAGSQAASTAS